MAESKMTKRQKEEFIGLVMQFVSENPECLSDVYEALEAGLKSALDRLQSENADMACGMITALELTSPKAWNKSRRELTRFITTLADWFKGAPVETKLRDWLREGEG